MIVGFTGTHEGMTQHQVTQFLRFLGKHRHEITEFHHGDCVGADADAHDVVEVAFGNEIIYIHPPSDPKKRAWKKSPHIARPRPYLERDQKIVDVCDVLVGAPKSLTRPGSLRGQGTWTTITRAEKVGRPVVMLEP